MLISRFRRELQPRQWLVGGGRRGPESIMPNGSGCIQPWPCSTNFFFLLLLHAGRLQALFKVLRNPGMSESNGLVWPCRKLRPWPLPPVMYLLKLGFL